MNHSEGDRAVIKVGTYSDREQKVVEVFTDDRGNHCPCMMGCGSWYILSVIGLELAYCESEVRGIG